MFQLPGAGDKEVLYGSSYGGGGEMFSAVLLLDFLGVFLFQMLNCYFFRSLAELPECWIFFCEGFSEPQLIITTHKNPNSVLASWCSSSCRKSGGRHRFTVLSLAALGRSHQERVALLPASLAWALCQPLSHAPQAGSPLQRAPRLQQGS